jgi:hypothetical protein
MDYLKDIITDIKKENCVLIIGPDIVDFGDKSFFETMCADLLANSSQSSLIDTAPQYVFPNEELLQLMPSVKETKLLRMMEEFYQKQSAFDNPLTKISQIPFPLIISLMPDERLRKLFEKQRLEYNYGHYPREGSHEPIERPTKEKPLIYNLLGDFNELDAIITFDHLFSFLSGIMGKRELPQVLQETLKKARTFVFLGVHFEKWYVQLLLRIITSNDKKDKYTILRNRSNHEVCTFVARRLELDFLETEPLNFLEDLYNECKQQDLLKTIKAKKRVKVFLSYSHLDKEMALSVSKSLSENNINVLIDENSMKAGEKIEDFINTVTDVDIVLPIISQNSLLSPWVSKEIITTIDKTNKHLLPCYIDKSFLENNFEANAKNIVSAKVKNINDLISQRGIASTEDLDAEKKIWTEYYTNLPKVLTEVNKRKCISLMEAEFSKNILAVINDINQIAKTE